MYRSFSSSVILASFFLPDFFFLGGIFCQKLPEERQHSQTLAKTRKKMELISYRSVVAVDNAAAGQKQLAQNRFFHPRAFSVLANMAD